MAVCLPKYAPMNAFLLKQRMSTGLETTFFKIGPLNGLTIGRLVADPNLFHGMALTDQGGSLPSPGHLKVSWLEVWLDLLGTKSYFRFNQCHALGSIKWLDRRALQLSTRENKQQGFRDGDGRPWRLKDRPWRYLHDHRDRNRNRVANLVEGAGRSVRLPMPKLTSVVPTTKKTDDAVAETDSDQYSVAVQLALCCNAILLEWAFWTVIASI